MEAMYLTFIDRRDVEGTISSDWSVEYDGPTIDAIETVIDELRTDREASHRELQDLSVALFSECPLKRIECLEERDESDSHTRSPPNR